MLRDRYSLSQFDNIRHAVAPVHAVRREKIYAAARTGRRLRHHPSRSRYAAFFPPLAPSVSRPSRLEISPRRPRPPTERTTDDVYFLTTDFARIGPIRANAH